MIKPVTIKLKDKEVIFEIPLIDQATELKDGLILNKENLQIAIEKFLQHYNKNLQDILLNHDTLKIVLSTGTNIKIEVHEPPIPDEEKSGIIYLNANWFMDYENYINDEG